MSATANPPRQAREKLPLLKLLKASVPFRVFNILKTSFLNCMTFTFCSFRIFRVSSSG